MPRYTSLGYSQGTLLSKWYTEIRSQRLVDESDEVHRWTVGRKVVKVFERDGTGAGAAGGDFL
jgi:acyl-CoA dehydrogenase